MVLIALKSQYVSLIITCFSFLCELLVIVVLYNIINFQECRTLLKGKELNVRRHRNHVQLVAISAALLFLTLEIVTSFLSDPDQIQRWNSEQCVSLGTVRDLKGDEAMFKQVDIVEDTCQTSRNNFTLQQVGNISEKTGQVQCSDPVYYTDINEQTVEGRLPKNGTALECVPGFCVFVFQVDNTVFISDAFLEKTSEKILSGEDTENIRFARTALLFNSTGLLPTFARRTAEAYSKFVTDTFELRRRAFLGSTRQQCPFVVEVVDATSIPLLCLCIVVTIWLISVLLFGFTMVFLRKKTFYNVGDPLHWALYTFRRNDEVVGKNPVVMYEVEKGQEKICVSQGAEETSAQSNDFIDDDDIDTMPK